VLAAKAPTLHEALDKAVEQGFAYLILDGTLISSDRCADKKTSRKGKEIDKWYSGKAHEPAGNVQALATPGGVPLWVCRPPRWQRRRIAAAPGPVEREVPRLHTARDLIHIPLVNT
jgi:hypothetical protein